MLRRIKLSHLFVCLFEPFKPIFSDRILTKCVSNLKPNVNAFSNFPLFSIIKKIHFVKTICVSLALLSNIVIKPYIWRISFIKCCYELKLTKCSLFKMFLFKLILQLHASKEKNRIYSDIFILVFISCVVFSTGRFNLNLHTMDVVYFFFCQNVCVCEIVLVANRFFFIECF